MLSPTTPSIPSTPDTTPNNNIGLRKEFKDFMDSYESFIDEYISFMKKYKDSNGTDYSQYVQKYSEFMTNFNKWENDNLNKDEAKYYLEVQNKVNQKIIDAAL